jgi:hypothetical protein
MATFTVTTGADVVDANDGVLSLREAVAAANATAAADTIVFAPNLFFVNTNSAANAAALEVQAGGGALTIRGDHDDDGQADVAFIGGFSHHVTVRAGANLTLVGVDLINGYAGGGIAASGTNGAQGAASTAAPQLVSPNGQYNYYPQLDNDPALSGAERALLEAYHGQDGADASAAGTGGAGGAGAAGSHKAGAIVNAGTLTLIRVGLGDNEAGGEAGGTGGQGGMGGFELKGRNGIHGHSYISGLLEPLYLERWGGPGGAASGGDGGDGSQGGDGGRGGAGGAGGNAAGAILNEAGATLSLTDVVFGGRLVSGYIERGNEATGGNGGRGGAGGAGRAGGVGGDGAANGYVDSGAYMVEFRYDAQGNIYYLPETALLATYSYRSGASIGNGGNGGDGGDGGAAGANGRGGHAAGAVLNLGTLTGRAAVADLNQATAGAGSPTGGGVGQGGAGASGARGGVGGDGQLANFDIAADTPYSAFQAIYDAQLGTRETGATGTTGVAGVAGANGTAGAAGQSSAGILTLPSGAQSVTEADALVYVHRLNGNADATNRISFNIIRIGEVDSALTVNWRIVGTGAQAVTATDFAGNVLPAGTVTLAAVTGYTLGATYDRTGGSVVAKSVARIDLDLAAALPGEFREGFRIELTSVTSSAPSVTAALGTAAVSGFVAGLAAPAGPTAGPDSLDGTDADNAIDGLGGNDTINGLGGNDTITGGPGADLMRGGTGNDRYSVDTALDQVVELVNQGTDTVLTTLATYVLGANVENVTATNAVAHRFTGNTLANVMAGNAGVDTLIGGAGNDTLQGGGANDWLYGGTNDDTFFVETATDRVIESLNQGIDTVRTAAPAYTLPAHVEKLVGTSAGGQALTGNGLANAVTGFTGADTLNGGLGDDTLDGGAGIDRLLGGAGNDSFRIEAASDVVIELVNQGIDTVIMLGNAGYTLGAQVENLVLAGTAGATGIGNTLGNAITGNAFGNTLYGLTGNDSLDGAGGVDVLIGGIGRDTLTGGAGNDQFRFMAPGETTLLAPDRIADFTPGQDRIDLRFIDGAFATPLAYVTGAPVAAGQVGVVAAGAGTWQVRGDLDGGGADFAITVVSATGPSAAWFLL